jgi:ABC-type polysaccharide/polyol phosphate export permease
MAPGLADLMRTFRNPSLILFMAWSDVRARYKRSVLGPLWITLGTAIGVVGLGFIWSELFHMERAVFIPLLTIGLILWQFISGCITEATSVFVRQTSLIRNLDLPISFHVAQLVLRQLINLAHNVPLFFLVVLILGGHFTWMTWLALPALLLVILNLFWMVLLIGILGARFRDLEYLISMIMPLLMFLSPVMYRPKALPFSGDLLLLNPIAHLIEIVRFPLLGEMPSMAVVAGNLILLVVGGALTLWLFNKKCDRVALWV